MRHFLTKICGIFLCFFLISHSAKAENTQGDSFTGADLYKSCSSKDSFEQGFCIATIREYYRAHYLGFLVGEATLLGRLCDRSATTFNKKECDHAYAEHDSKRIYCVPDNENGEQIKTIFLRWMKNNQELSDQDAEYTIGKSFESAFGDSCKL